MASDYYTHTTFPATGSAGTSASMRAELDKIDQGFQKLPALAGNAGKFAVVKSDATSVTVSANLFESGSNVGVGTASPATLLHISGSAPRFRVADTAGGSYDMRVASGSLIFDRVGVAERLAIDAAGNIAALANGGSLVLGPASLITGLIKLQISDGTITSAYGYKSGGVEYLGTHSNHAVAVLTNNAERMRVDPAGPVLINRTSSSGLGQLQVFGNIDAASDTAVALNLRTAPGQEANVHLAGNGTGIGSGEFLLRSAADGTAYVFNRSNKALIFGTNNTDRLLLDAAGNLISYTLASVPSLTTAGQMVFNLTSDTNLRVSVRGSDGVTRTANLTLS